MSVLILKAIAVWILLVMVAIANAGLREKILLHWFGAWSLPLSGITLSLLIFLTTLAIIPWLATPKPLNYLLIGSLWLIFTLGFEFIFGHFVMGKAWTEILSIFNIQRGNLMTLVLLTTWFAPYFAAYLRKLI